MTDTLKQLRNRYRGALLGLAAGDALGTTNEFKPPGSFPLLTDMVGGGVFRLQPGQWTDDCSTALCLAQSLIECRGFDPKDQMERYVRWWDDGYLSSTGRCFDIGITVSGALSRYLQTGDPFAGSTDPHSAGNGSLMRLAPIPLAFRAKPEQALWYAGESSRTTHGAPAAIDACKLYCRRSIQNQPVGVELKPATFFPLNRSEMFWQGAIQDFSDNPAVTNRISTDLKVVVTESFAFDA